MTRVVTLNVWQEQGPWAARLELTAGRLAALEPDVVCLQEVRQVEGRIPNQAATLAERLGLSFVYELAQEWGGGEEGLAILSRHRIAARAARELPFTAGRSRRVCLGAGIDGDAGRFWVFTTHLAWRLADGDLRERQVLEVDELVRTTRGSAPAVLTGDFNATPDADEMRFLRGLTTLGGRRTYFQDAFAQCNPGAPGYTWAAENPYTRQMAWLEADRRLDYIYVSPRTRAGGGAIGACRLVCTEPDARGIRCSDHYGVLADVDLAGSP